MLREIISRRPSKEVPYAEEDNYYPVVSTKVKY